jgi:bacteriorhodopsin
VIRYMQWLFTTPAMIYLYSLLSCVPTRDVMISMANGALVILTGYLANILPPPFNIMALVGALLAFFMVMKILDQTISIAVADCCSTEEESYCGALKGAKLLTTFSWVGIPAVWILAYFGLLSHSAEELLYEVFDFIIKSGVSCIIMHSSLKTHAEKKEERMRAELAEERGTIKALRETARMKVSLIPAHILSPSISSQTKKNHPRRRRTSSPRCRTSCARPSSESSASPTASSPAGP